MALYATHANLWVWIQSPGCVAVFTLPSCFHRFPPTMQRVAISAFVKMPAPCQWVQCGQSAGARCPVPRLLRQGFRHLQLHVYIVGIVVGYWVPLWTCASRLKATFGSVRLGCEEQVLPMFASVPSIGSKVPCGSRRIRETKLTKCVHAVMHWYLIHDSPCLTGKRKLYQYWLVTLMATLWVGEKKAFSFHSLFLILYIPHAFVCNRCWRR